MPGRVDKYSNIMSQRVTMSSANTLTFAEIQVGLNIFDKVGLLISRIDYNPNSGALTEMTAAGDLLIMGLAQSDQFTGTVLTERALIDILTFQRQDFGTAAAAALTTLPFINDLSTLPGGGIIVVPRPLFLLMNSVGLASVAVCDIRIYFTVVDLKPEEYFELLEARQFFG